MNHFPNPKKQLGIALNELKAAAWFKDLSPDDQQFAIQSTKDFYTPPNPMENTCLNLAISAYQLTEKWQQFCQEHFPWANPVLGNAQVNLSKRAFFTLHFPAP